MNHLKNTNFDQDNFDPSIQEPKLAIDEFSKGWGLCHHLKFSVHAMAKASQTRLGQLCVKNLQMAEWHLMRKITSEQQGFSNDSKTFSPFYQPLREAKIHVCSSLIMPSPIMPSVFAKDWGMSRHLQEAVFYITAFQKLYHQFPRTRPVLLKRALYHLRNELELQRAESSRAASSRLETSKPQKID